MRVSSNIDKRDDVWICCVYEDACKIEIRLVINCFTCWNFNRRSQWFDTTLNRSL